MKLKLQFSIAILAISLFSYGQETTVDLSMGAGYADQVYYKLSTETQTSFVANSWDIAFLRNSNFNQGIVVNDGIGIQVFEAASNALEWDTINISSDSDTWTELYNSDTERSIGAFNQGSATYGWGEYNVVTHIVEGSIIFVLKYADGTYKKFITENYAGGVYSIKYASFDTENSTWGESATATISNADNLDNNYNYYSLQNNEKVLAEPAATDWDLVFRKYYTNVGGGTMYSVTGALQGDNVEVAQVLSDSNTSDLAYTTDINSIGYDWKALNYQTFAFDVDSDTHFYVKDEDENVYKLYFTEFGGTSTGDVQFKFEDVTSTLSIEEVSESVSFGVYPNPVNSDRKINIVFDVNNVNKNNNSVGIYDVTGKKIYETSVVNTQGFYTKEIDVSNLNSGVYLLRFTSGNYNKSKKIIIE